MQKAEAEGAGGKERIVKIKGGKREKLGWVGRRDGRREGGKDDRMLEM